MERPIFKKPVALFASFALLIGCASFIFLTQESAPEKPTSSDPVSLTEASTEISAEDEVENNDELKQERGESFLEYRSVKNDAVMRVSLTQAALLDEEGMDTIVRLDPPATVDTLAERLAELEAPRGVMPLVYEDNGNPIPRMLTSKILAKLPQEQAEQLAAKHGLEINERPWYAPEYVVFEAAQPLEALEKIVGIRGENFVETAEVMLTINVSKRQLPNDPLAPRQWHLRASGIAVAGSDINVENVWDYDGTNGIRGEGVGIVIIDDGLQIRHPDLVGNVDLDNNFDFTARDGDPTPVADNAHGTACGGVAAGVGNNDLGITGVAPEATLHGIRLIDTGFEDSESAAALLFEMDIIDISSNSWGPPDSFLLLGGPERDSLTAAALKTGAETGRGGKGTIYSWAAGNGRNDGDNSNYDSYANSIYTIAVAATNSDATNSWYSEPGANLVISAPSNGLSSQLGIVTTDITGASGYSNATAPLGADYTGTFGGTSSACPTVSGAVALILEANPALGWRDVQEILITSAKKVDPADTDWIVNGAGFNFNHDYGPGLLDVEAAVNLATTWTNLEEQISASSILRRIAATIPNNNATGVTREFDLSDSNIRVEHVTLTVDLDTDDRADLEITLISPNGTESRLAEVHRSRFGGESYENWTFSSVRCWGENSRGIWTVKIADRSSLGSVASSTLNLLELTVFGSSDAPFNPAPQVVITDPLNGTPISPNANVTVAVTATDFDIDGNLSGIQDLRLFANDSLVGILIGPSLVEPYIFNYIANTPGNVALVARATDVDDRVGESAPVNIFVANQVPVVEDFTVNYASQAFVDEQLSVISVDTSDPEDNPVTVSYQWRFSTDLENYADQPGATSADLPISPDNAGKVWVCEIRASDDQGNTSEPTETNPVNVLRRAPASVQTGDGFSYDSGLVLNGSEREVNRAAIIHEFSQGSQGTQSEWVEILVMQDSDLGSWVLTDADGNDLIFLSDAWAGIPAGTLIVIYNGSSLRDPLVSSQSLDPSSGLMIVASTNRNYFSASGAVWPDFINTGDAIFLRNATGETIHSIAYGTSVATTPNVGNVPSLGATYFAGQEDPEADDASNWINTTASMARSLPVSKADPRVAFTFGAYSQNFDVTPGDGGRNYPEGWTSYNRRTTTTTTTTEDTNMRLQADGTLIAGNYNFESKIGLMGNSTGQVFDPSFLALTLDNTEKLTDLKISYDVVKVAEGGRSMQFDLQYTTSSPGATTTTWTSIPSGGHVSGNSVAGTITPYANVSLPAVFNNRDEPIYLRWFYRTASGTGGRDALALDNVVITSAQEGLTFLELTFQPDTVLENAGNNSSVGMVTANNPVSVNTTVLLTSSNTSEVTVPASVVIRAGQTSATFPIGVADNALTDGTRNVTITAVSTGLVGDEEIFSIADDDAVAGGVTPGSPNGGVNDVFVSQLRSGVLRNPPSYRLGQDSDPLPDGLVLNSATGVIFGTISPNATPGPYSIVIELTNVIGDFTSHTFQLNLVGPVPTFADWIAGFMVLDGTANGDPDFDLFPNFLEYAMGTRPDLVENPSPVIFVREGENISITYPELKGLPNIGIVAEWSTSMEDDTWSNTEIISSIVTEDDAMWIRKATLAVDPLDPKRFMRLRVIEVPGS